MRGRCHAWFRVMVISHTFAGARTGHGSLAGFADRPCGPARGSEGQRGTGGHREGQLSRVLHSWRKTRTEAPLPPRVTPRRVPRGRAERGSRRGSQGDPREGGGCAGLHWGQRTQQTADPTEMPRLWTNRGVRTQTPMHTNMHTQTHVHMTCAYTQAHVCALANTRDKHMCTNTCMQNKHMCASTCTQACMQTNTCASKCTQRNTCV